MTPKYQFAVTSGNGDPFAQLTQELATFRDEQIERQLRKGEQINLSLSDADVPECTESPPTPSDATTWTCRSCFHKDATRQLQDGYGPGVCDRCGERVLPPTEN